MITLLMDCSSACYRAYYTTGGMSSGGSATGIPYGFFYSLLMLSERFHTNKFIFCWDSKTSKRRKLFDDYKVSRRKDLTDEEREEKQDLYAQINALRDEIIPRAGFKNGFHQEGLEADDLIAQAVIDNPTTTFVGVSGDNDLFQLLRFKNYTMFSPTANKLWTASSFALEYGVPARDWVAVKSIAGCPGDGVPGVPGVATKTAVQYLNGELRKGKKCTAIENDKACIVRNYSLVALPFKGTEAVKAMPDDLSIVKLLQLFSDLGFQSFLTRPMQIRWSKFVEGYVK